MDKKNLDYLDRHRCELEQVTADEFSEYLKSRGASEICLSCKSQELLAVTTTRLPKKIPLDSDEHIFDQYKFMQLFFTKSDGNFIDPIDILYKVCCKNCGFTTSYLSMKVVAWLNKSGEYNAEK